jgi:peptidoglycan/LPS O-acetylase OafA/YrhL
MDSTNTLLIGIFILGAIALIGFFWTKTNGFGKYSTCALVLLVALILSALLFAGGQLDSQLFTNALMAIIGFAGGLVVSKE